MDTENKKSGNASFYIKVIVLAAALIVFDHITKYLAVITLKGKPSIVLVKGLELYYLENRGAAWGLLQNRQGLFTVLTVIFIVICVYYFIRIPKTRRFTPLSVCVTFLLAGALGNFIDRVVNKYVVDFIYFSSINFPVFNVADICVSLSVIAIILLLLFRYKDADFAALKMKKDKTK